MPIVCTRGSRRSIIANGLRSNQIKSHFLFLLYRLWPSLSFPLSSWLLGLLFEKNKIRKIYFLVSVAANFITLIISHLSVKIKTEHQMLTSTYYFGI